MRRLIKGEIQARAILISDVLNERAVSYVPLFPPGWSCWKVDMLKTSLPIIIHKSSGLLCEATSLRVNVLDMRTQVESREYCDCLVTREAKILRYRLQFLPVHISFVEGRDFDSRKELP